MSQTLVSSMIFYCSRILVVIAFLGVMVTSLTGCQAPSVNDAARLAQPTPGKSIVAVDSETLARNDNTFQPTLVTLPTGEDVWVSPYPLGKHGGSLRMASIGSGPKTFNPWVAKDSTSSEMGGMLCSGLAGTNPYTGAVRPDLAKTITVQPDGKTVVVTLRKGLKWSDGKPLTSHDVVFTWNHIIKTGVGNASMRDNTLVNGQFPSVVATDDQTLVFKTVVPFAPFLRRLGYPIAPAHVFEPLLKKLGPTEFAQAFNNTWTTDEALKHPKNLVSSGLWVLKQYDPATQHIVFVKNPYASWVDKNHTRLPYVSEYSVRTVADMNNVALRFEQGDIDVYSVPGQNVSHVRQLTQPSFTLYNLGPSDTKSFVMLNMAQRKDVATGQTLVDTVKTAWFRNTAFRQALSMALNRDDMVANVFKGIGQPACTAESPASPFYDATLLVETQGQCPSQNIQRAKALLKQAGFTWNTQGNTQGQLLDPAGNRVRFELLTNSGNDQRETLGVMIAEDWKALGIMIDFRPLDFNVLIGKFDTGAWEASIMGLGGGSPLEPHDGANVWRSDGALHMFNQRPRRADGTVNLADRLPWEVELDTLFNQGAQTLAEPKRKPIYRRYQQVVLQQQPFMFLAWPLSLVAVHQRLHNVYPTPFGGVLHNIESVWVDAP